MNYGLLNLSLKMAMTCKLCGQVPNREQRDRTLIEAGLFGAEKYALCAVCLQEVPQPWTDKYKLGWDERRMAVLAESAQVLIRNHNGSVLKFERDQYKGGKREQEALAHLKLTASRLFKAIVGRWPDDKELASLIPLT
jgi:hypothetical protein